MFDSSTETFKSKVKIYIFKVFNKNRKKGHTYRYNDNITNHL